MGFLWCPHCKEPHALNTTSCPKTGRRIALGITPAEQALAQRGTLIGKRYKVRTLMGTESVGLVYLAKQIATGRHVLLKAVHDDDSPRLERIAELAEMEREARAASMIEHPNVAPVLDFERLGDAEGFLVREQHSTAKLASALRATGALDASDAVDLMSQVLSAVHAIDQAGLVHRDLATHNIYVQQRVGCRPAVKVAGLGRSSGSSLGNTPDPPSGIHYASPELLSKGARGSVDHRSDLFSCGVLLFEMLTGRRPFEAATEDEVRRAILEDEPPSAAKLVPGLTGEWLEVLAKALAKDPADRFQTALELQRALPSRSRPTARLQLLSDSAEQVALTDTAPVSEGPRSRAGANIGSKCDPYIGRVLGNGYALETLLGTGGAGAVYKANHMRLQRPVAVKILHDRNRASQQFVERFKAEALLASKLDHPNVTRILDCGEESDGRLYLVMEYLEGRSLAAVLLDEGRLTQARAVNIAIQLLSSLVVAHGAGIIHRDVKPDNIILLVGRDEDGTQIDRVKVCDFGIAKLHQHHTDQPDGGPEGDVIDSVSDDDDRFQASDLTTSGLILGSPIYMAPEQVRADSCDERTDLYAVGVTLFEMLTGRWPHEAESMVNLFRLKLTERATRPSTFTDDIDPLVEDIILRSLEPAPERRHSSAAEMRSELLEALAQFRPAPGSRNTFSISPDSADAEPG